MNIKERGRIIDELNERIQDAENADDNDVAFALTNFYEWFLENYVY